MSFCWRAFTYPDTDIARPPAAYERRFGEYIPETGAYGFTAEKLAYLNSLPILSTGIGVVLGSQIGEYLGRKKTFFLMNALSIIGITVAYTAEGYAQALTARMVMSLYGGIAFYLVPMFIAEIAPAGARGSLVTLFVVGTTFAAFISSIITNETSSIDNDNCWKIPTAAGFAFPAFALVFHWLIPESPRWLLRRGRYDDAVRALSYLDHSSSSDKAEKEATLLREALQQGTTKGKWSDLFRETNMASSYPLLRLQADIKSTNDFVGIQRRTVLGIAISCFNHLTGITFANQYGTIFLKSINAMDPFTAQMIKRALMVLATIVAIMTSDKAGRRRTFHVSNLFVAFSLMVMGGLGTVEPSTLSVKKGILAMTFLFSVSHLLLGQA